MKLKLLLLLAVLVVLSGLLELERKPPPARKSVLVQGYDESPDTVKTSVQVAI
jgi:hypothetical protein